MTQTATREITILARVEFKADSRKVVYKVLSSNGVDTYQTSLFNGKACSCNCPSHKPCYHMTGCEAHEAARNARKEQESRWVTMPNGTQRLRSQINDVCLNSLDAMSAAYSKQEDERKMDEMCKYYEAENACRAMMHALYNPDNLG